MLHRKVSRRSTSGSEARDRFVCRVEQDLMSASEQLGHSTSGFETERTSKFIGVEAKEVFSDLFSFSTMAGEELEHDDDELGFECPSLNVLLCKPLVLGF